MISFIDIFFKSLLFTDFDGKFNKSARFLGFVITYKKNITKFFDDLLETPLDTGFRKFFYRSRSTVLVTLLISSKTASNAISLEDVLGTIPRQLISRTTIKSILDEGVTQNYFIKNSHRKDKRRKVYLLNSLYMEVIVDWVNRQKKIFCDGEG